MFGADNNSAVSVACASADLDGTLSDMAALVQAGQRLAIALRDSSPSQTNSMWGAGYLDKLNEAWAPYGVMAGGLKVTNTMPDETVKLLCEVLRNLYYISRPEVESSGAVATARVGLEQAGYAILAKYVPGYEPPAQPSALGPIKRSWVFYGGLAALGVALGGIVWFMRERNRGPRRRRR